MADIQTFVDCPPRGDKSSQQAAFLSLHYHFGMLLGVTDFETEQACHFGKMRLHNMWLHRRGVVWGFGVEVDIPHGEIRVLPGLALDGLGRELHLEKAACLSVPAWLKVQSEDATIFDKKRKTVTFNADVVIRYKTCLTRQVPALMEPCKQAETATAYSRVFETIDIRLVPFPPKTAPAAKPQPYRRLRLLFGLEPFKLPADQPLKDIVDAIANPANKLAAFSQFSALDVIDLQPPAPGEDESVTLARITKLSVTTDDSGNAKIAFANNDVTVRPTLVATGALQELFAGT